MGSTSSVDTLLPAVCQRSGSIARWLGKANLFSRLIRGGRWQNRGVAQPIFEQVEKLSSILEDKAAFGALGEFPFLVRLGDRRGGYLLRGQLQRCCFISAEVLSQAPHGEPRSASRPCSTASRILVAVRAAVALLVRSGPRVEALGMSRAGR